MPQCLGQVLLGRKDYEFHNKSSPLEQGGRSPKENKSNESVLIDVCIHYMQKKLKSSLKGNSQTRSSFLQLSLLLAGGDALIFLIYLKHVLLLLPLAAPSAHQVSQ